MKAIITSPRRVDHELRAAVDKYVAGLNLAIPYWYKLHRPTEPIPTVVIGIPDSFGYYRIWKAIDGVPMYIHSYIAKGTTKRQKADEEPISRGNIYKAENRKSPNLKYVRGNVFDGTYGLSAVGTHTTIHIPIPGPNVNKSPCIHDILIAMKIDPATLRPMTATE